MDGWHDFFIAAAGSAATLTGLVFVALSVNKDRIGAEHSFRSLARQTILALMSVLGIALLALIPEPSQALGVEFLAGGLAVLLPSMFVQKRVLPSLRDHARVSYLVRAAVFNSALIMVAVVGLAQSLGADRGAAFGLVAATLALGGLAIVNSWDLVMGVDTPLPSPDSPP